MRAGIIPFLIIIWVLSRIISKSKGAQNTNKAQNPAARPAAQPAGRQVAAQRYTQREYDEKELEERLGVNDLFRGGPV
jgi:hypothetical protein